MECKSVILLTKNKESFWIRWVIIVKLCWVKIRLNTYAIMYAMNELINAIDEGLI